MISLAYVGRRLVESLLVLIGASFTVYAALFLAPGDPTSFLLRDAAADPAAIAAITRQFHLDDPLPIGYLRWVAAAAAGDFGTSIQFRGSVSEIIGSRLGVTVQLMVLASMLTVGLGLMIGILSAVAPRVVDRMVGGVMGALGAVPPFVAASLLISVFAIWLGVLPAVGMGDGTPLDDLRHLILPAFALALANIGLLARVARTSLQEQLDKEYVEVATIRGIDRRRVVLRYATRNALTPVVTILGTSVAAMVAGTVIVETGFGLAGIGSLLVQSVSVQDFPIVQAIILIIVTAFLIISLIVDLLQPVLDPRVRLGART